MGRGLIYLLSICVLVLPACSNPEASAQAGMKKAQADWQAAAQDPDPVSRVKRYGEVIDEVKAIAKDYPKTKVGGAIASGRAVDGLSLTGMQRRLDGLAPRAACYADPTVQCLLPFGSGAAGRRSANAPQSAFAVAGQRICEQGFVAADKALKPIKINKRAYAKDLIQLGFAAAKCNRPEAVRAAVGAYMAADPASGGQRARDLLQVLGTKDFAPAHSMVIAELEKEMKSGAIGGRNAADVTLTLAVHYAKAGDAKAAMEKYTYFTETLHYRAGSSTLDTLSTNLMADGDTRDGIKLTQYATNQDVLAPRLRAAAATLAARMGLVASDTTAWPALEDKDIETYFAPVDATKKAGYEAGAGAIEAAIDKLAPRVHRSGAAVGDVGLDAGYGLLALVRQKLGEPEKANALIKKAAGFRARLLGSSARVSETFAKQGMLLAMARGDLVTAAHYVAAANLNSDAYGRMLMREVGRTQNAENALSIANTIGRQRDLWHCYSDMIPVMAKAGRVKEAEKLINAWSGDPRQKSGFYWAVVDGRISAGDVDGARRYAEQFGLAKDDRGKFRLDGRLMSAKVIAADPRKAEPIIREMFRIGQAVDAKLNASRAYRNRLAFDRSRRAQSAVTLAFENGYTDLGIELYGKAAYKDQRPLLVAFTPNISKADMTRVLMLAQDNVRSPRYRSYVVDAAVRHLQASGS